MTPSPPFREGAGTAPVSFFRKYVFRELGGDARSAYALNPQRHPDCKSRSSADFARHADFAGKDMRHTLRNREAKAHAALGPCRGGIDLRERLEHARQILSGD